MAAITPSTRTVDTAASQIDEIRDDANIVEMVVLLVLFVALVGFAVTHLDTALAGFRTIASH